MGYILGIDHGNSKTAAVVMDFEGVILGHSRIPNAEIPNPEDESNLTIPRIMAISKSAYDRALADAGLHIEDIEIACGGLTGADWPEEYAALEGALREAIGVQDTTVVNDCAIAFWGAKSERYGAVVCAGSGLNVGTISPDGVIEAYGWYIDADCSGSGALGERAIRAVISAEAGVIEPTALTGIVLGACQVQTVEELIRKNIAGQLPIRPHELAPRVLDAAAEGDAAAAEIALDVARKAAKYAIAGLWRRGMADMDCTVVLSGSVFKHRSDLMRGAAARVIHDACPRARVVDAEYEPVVGAALMALEHRRGGSLPEGVWANVHDSCAKFGLTREIG